MRLILLRLGLVTAFALSRARPWPTLFRPPLPRRLMIPPPTPVPRIDMATRCPTARLAAWAPCASGTPNPSSHWRPHPGRQDAGFRGADNVVRLWDVRSGKQVLRVPGFEENRYGLAIAPDGKTAASPGGGVIHIWNTTTGKDVGLLHIPGARSNILGHPVPGLSPDRSSSQQPSATLRSVPCDIATPKLLCHHPEHKGKTSRSTASAFSPDGKYFAGPTGPGLLVGGLFRQTGSSRRRGR